MSGEDERPSGADRERWDEELSAWLDGELDAEREAALRAELERDPRLAARAEALRAVDAGLRALPGPPVPSDLRARLQARIEASGAPTVQDAPGAPTVQDAGAPTVQDAPEGSRAGAATPAPPARAAAPRRRRRWAPALAAAAVAAAIALSVWVRRPDEEHAPERMAESPPPGSPERIAEGPAPESPATDEPAAPEEIAVPRAASDASRVADRASEPEPAPVDLEAASDEELRIAMDWRLVDEDLEMIEQLELLEAMLARERGQG